MARKVYRACLRDAMDTVIGMVLVDTGDPRIFRSIDALDLRRTRPSMLGADGNYPTTHDGISDLIAQQLRPGD